MIKGKIFIEDTTLRDGEQTPGVSFSVDEKLELAKSISEILSEDDSIDAGFSAVSEEEAEAVKKICQTIHKNHILSLARLKKKDIDSAFSAMKYTEKRKIGLIIPTSDLHIRCKLQTSREELIQQAVKSVDYAHQYFKEVEVGFEDASRSDYTFIYELTEKLIDSGVTSITLADTLGYWVPGEAAEYIENVKKNVQNINELQYLGVHCHNDLGLALANSVEALHAGANKIGTSFNGLGERAGNVSTETFLLLQKVKKSYFSNRNREKYTYQNIWNCSRLLEEKSQVFVQKNAPVVGRNCYIHESGIHQDGILKEKSTYQLFDPKLAGFTGDIFYYGKHSGKSGIAYKLKSLGVNPDMIDMDVYLKKFKELCSLKKEFTNEDFLKIL